MQKRFEAEATLKDIIDHHILEVLREINNMMSKFRIFANKHNKKDRINKASSILEKILGGSFDFNSRYASFEIDELLNLLLPL